MEIAETGTHLAHNKARQHRHFVARLAVARRCMWCYGAMDSPSLGQQANFFRMQPSFAEKSRPPFFWNNGRRYK
jgi:hypothetical protein